tara:strand:- start:537 stop:932 length:396 start_codon:yes stop_codon:yes gene_type:complete
MEGILGLGIGYVAVLMPAVLLGVIFFFDTKREKNKYDAMIEISKSITDPSHIRDLLEDFQEPKKQPIDYRRGGVITLFVGIGLFLFGVYFIDILKGVGLLVAAIGVGSIIAGYLYPNDSVEITKAVEKFEE